MGLETFTKPGEEGLKGLGGDFQDYGVALAAASA